MRKLSPRYTITTTRMAVRLTILRLRRSSVSSSLSLASFYTGASPAPSPYVPKLRLIMG